MAPQDFDELEALLDDMRTRNEGVPQWEFCEGFMAALICCRRLIMPSEYFPVLLGDGDADLSGVFADAEQTNRFMALWMQRWNEVAAALNNEEVEALDDPACYHPEVLDVRGAVAALPEAEQAKIEGEPLPSFAQIWAMGFMEAVQSWPDEWRAPRGDKESAEWLDEALQAISSLMEDDQGTPEISPLSDDTPPSLSTQRLEDFGAAIWAVYELRELWRSVGPRVATVRKETSLGRNDLCHCGSGKKYKKCHGAN